MLTSFLHTLQAAAFIATIVYSLNHEMLLLLILIQLILLIHCTARQTRTLFEWLKHSTARLIPIITTLQSRFLSKQGPMILHQSNWVASVLRNLMQGFRC